MARHRVIVPAGPVAPGVRRVEAGGTSWDLRAPDLKWGDTWTWRPHGWVQRVWSLETAAGTILILHPLGRLHREWRAEAASGTWTLSSSWAGHVTVTDAGGAVRFTHHRGWLGRGRIETPEGEILTFWRHWLLRFALETTEGYELMSITRAPGIFTREHVVTLSDVIRKRNDLLPLVALAWRLALVARRSHAH